MGEHDPPYPKCFSWAGRFSTRGALAALGLALLAALGPVVATAGAAGPTSSGDGSELPALPFDHFMPYEEFTRLLHDWAAARPGLVKLESLGQTLEGRELWFLTITNPTTGPASS